MVNKNTMEVINIECIGIDSVVGNAKSLIEKTLYVKERFNISDVAYHELAQLKPAFPRQSALVKVSKRVSNTAHPRANCGSATVYCGKA